MMDCAKELANSAYANFRLRLPFALDCPQRPARGGRQYVRAAVARASDDLRAVSQSPEYLREILLELPARHFIDICHFHLRWRGGPAERTTPPSPRLKSRAA